MAMPERFLALREFRNGGFLQEVNRQFFHPLGLALAVTFPRDGAVAEIERATGRTVSLDDTELSVRIIDCRDDPEGFYFGDADPEKAAAVDALRESKAAVRKERFGAVVQPLPNT